MQDSLWVIRIFNIVSNTENISAFTYEVLNVIIITFVRELSKFALLRGELLVKIKEVKRWWGQVLNAW